MLGSVILQSPSQHKQSVIVGYHLLFRDTSHPVFVAREKLAIPPTPIISPTTHFFPPVPLRRHGLGRAHPSSATLTVVALGLGGLAFPLLPVLLPLFVSDFPFCSLTGKSKQCQLCYQSMQKQHP